MSFSYFSLTQVGDIVSVIDMPPKEDTGWWRGKHGFQVKDLTTREGTGYIYIYNFIASTCFDALFC